MPQDVASTQDANGQAVSTDQHKSWVDDKNAKPSPKRAFDKDDEVLIPIDGVSHRMTVVDTHLESTYWVYQLKTADGQLHRGGAWVAQSQLALAK